MTRTHWIFTALVCTAVSLTPAMEHDGEKHDDEGAATTTTDQKSSVSTGTTTPAPELDEPASANESDADATPRGGSSAGSMPANGNEIATGTAEPVPEGKDPEMANARENEAAGEKPIDDESEAMQAGQPAANRETVGDPTSVNEQDHDSTVDQGARTK